MNLDRNYIPPDIATVEQLFVWASMTLTYAAENVNYTEAPGEIYKAIVSGIFYMGSDSPPGWRHVTRASVPVNKEWQGGDQPLWQYAQPIADGDIPASFQS